jgi:taurine dioxygenase
MDSRSLATAAGAKSRQAVEIIPFGGPIGAELSGLDLSQGVSESEMQALWKALDDFSVVVLRDQQIAPRDHVALAKRLGPIRTSFYNRYSVPGQPELSVVSNIKENGEAIGIADAGMLWHTDASYLKTPDLYTLLYGIEIPHQDGAPLGDTLFSSTWAAYEGLDGETKARIRQLRAIHSFVDHLEKKRRANNLKRAPLTEAQKAELPDVSHPVVRTHPRTGKLCLYVTEGHTSSIVGLPEDESRSLLEFLWAQIRNPEYHYRHKWRKGDLVIWDNCAVQHLAIFDYGEVPRRLHRAGVMGAEPV